MDHRPREPLSSGAIIRSEAHSTTREGLIAPQAFSADHVLRQQGLYRWSPTGWVSNWDRAAICCGCLKRFQLEVLGFGLEGTDLLWKCKPEDDRTPLLAVSSNLRRMKTLSDVIKHLLTFSVCRRLWKALSNAVKTLNHIRRRLSSF